MNDRTKYRKKRIQEVTIGQKIRGTEVIARAYWDFMEGSHGNHPWIGEDSHEDPLANPDVLPSDHNMSDRPLTEEGEVQMEAVHQTMAELTPLQQRIVRLSFDGVWSDTAGERLFTVQAIADALGVKRETVKTLLGRVAAKVRRRYEKLKAEYD